MSVPVSMTLTGKQINVSVAVSSRGPAAMHGEVWIGSISKAIPIAIGRGENRGREVTYYNVVRNLLKVGDWNGSSGSWTVPLGKYLPRGCRCRGGLHPGRQSRQARPDAGRGVHVAALIDLTGYFLFREAGLRLARPNRNANVRTRSPKRKRTNSRWPSIGVSFLRTGPILTTPGGWGLRNPVPKGPGQRSIPLSQSRRAVDGRKWGSIMILLTIP